MNKSTTAFVSYAKEDSEWVARLVRDLRDHGVHLWFDRDDLLPGQKWEEEIRKAIERSRFFIAMLSNNSIDKKGFVQRELKQAFEVLESYPSGEIYLIPVRLDNCSPEAIKIKERHWVDLYIDWESGVQKLLKVLAADIVQEISTDDNLQHGLGHIHPSILAPLQGLVSATRLLMIIAREAGADEEKLRGVKARVEEEIEILRLWRENQRVCAVESALSLTTCKIRPIFDRAMARYHSSLLQRYRTATRMERQGEPRVCY